MSDPALGLTMLGLIVVAIMLGFPTAFTLMGLGMMFGYASYYNPAEPWWQNRIFDLMVQRTYGAMNNETLLSIPLFVLMGYVMERGALVDKMFYSVQLAFRRVPANLAVATLVVCTFWGIASGLVGAVVVLMGVIAMAPMLKAGYDTRLAAGVITAGGTLGILIPPSVMIIVYAAVAGQSVVKLYAAAMFPGFFLAALYLVYILGWALIDPKVAPAIPKEQLKAPVPKWVSAVAERYSPNLLVGLLKAVLSPGRVLGEAADKGRVTLALLARNLAAALVPLVLVLVSFGIAWWYVVVYQTQQQAEAAGLTPMTMDAANEAATKAEASGGGGNDLAEPPAEGVSEPEGSKAPEGVAEPPGAEPAEKSAAPAQELGADLREQMVKREISGPGPAFYGWFWGLFAAFLVILALYYWKFDAEQFTILRLLVESVFPLGILTVVVLAVILFGITTATESAAVGAAGAFLLAWQAKTLNFERTKEAVFLTAKTTAMVCWLFVGSALFSAVFATLGGQQLVEKWVLAFDLSPVQFMILSQAIIFILGWPLEWTEIIVIFVPIFLPLLTHFNIDPVLWGVLVFVNLQAAFLSPPVAMSAFYLKGVSPPHVTLNQIFAGMMPYMVIVIVCMVIMYLWPGLTLWLPNYLYGS